MQDNINKLYNVLKNDGYEDLGTEEKFRNFVNDSANVKKLYGVLKNDGYEDLGTEDQFISFVMPKQQASKPQGMIATAIQAPEPPASIAKPENGLPLQKFDVAEQNQENAEKLRMQQENTPFMRQQRATEQQTTAMNQPAFPDIEAPQLSRSIGDDRQKYKGMVSQAVKDAVGAKSETALADAMKATRQELARQGYDMDALQDSGLLSEGIDNVIIPTAEAAVTKGRKIIDKVFDDAKVRAQKARTDATRYTGMGGPASAASSLLMGEKAYNKEIDPDKLQQQLVNAIDKDGLRETFNEVYRQAVRYGIDPKEYFNTYVAPHLKDNAARALDKFMTDQYMPKNDAEYILSGFSDSITGMLSDWLTKSAKQNAYKQMALSKYDASTGTQIAREAVGLLSSAPEFMASGGVASAVTKKVCGKAIQNIMAKGFTRMQAQRILTAELASKFGQRVAERIVQSSVSGSANFATLESMSEAARQLRDDDFNAGKIALKGVEGAGKGAIFGAVSGGYAGATSELTGATKIISNFLGIPANGLSLTLSSNAINEVSKMMGGEDELMEVDAEGNSKRKSFMQQWADNTLLDLMMRGTSHHNFNVITREGRSDLTARMKSFFSPLSDSQKMFGKTWGSGMSEEGKARLMQITGTDNLRDALMSGVPKASDMPSLPFQADIIDGKTRSKSLDDILREEQRSVMQQNWDKIMHDRELTAADKAKLCMIMGAKFHTNPSVTMTTVTGADGEKYVEYRDAAGMLNERVPLYDADLGQEAQNKLRMRNIYSKTSALGKQGEYAVAAGAMRYAMEPDAEGNIPTEEQQKKRASEYFDRFRKGELTDMEITELEADLNKATLSYDGADKIKVLKHGDGTASVQYTKNGVPVRTDHFGTEEEANERASRDLYQQQLNSINEWREDVGIPLDDGSKLSIEQVYELKNNMPLGTLQQAIEGYPGMSMDEVRDKLLNSGLTSVDLVTGPDGIIRTAEQDKLIRDYYDWAKKTVDGMDAKKAQPDTEGLYQMGEGGAPDSITPAFKAPETPIAENGPGTEEERTYNGPGTEAQVQQPEVQPQQQPEAVPAAAPQNAINENTSHGKAYSSGYNAVSANDLATVRAIKDNQELAARRVNDVVKNTNPVIENILSLTKQGKHAEAHALIDSTPMPEEQADALRQYIDADAGVNGMQDAVEQIKDARIREYQAKVEAQAQENGEDVTIVVLDNSGKKAKLVKGDLDNMGGTVMIHDLDANDNPVGEPHQVHVKQIKRVFPTQKVKDMIFAERKRIQQEIDAYFDNAVSPTNFEIGKKVVLKDGGSIVEATVIGVNPDGSINFQSDTGEVHTIDRAEAERMAADGQEAGYGIRLQAEAEARAAARKQAEEQQKAQAEAEARRQAEEAARKAEEERRKNPLNRLKRREDNTIDYTNSNPDDVAELLQNLGAKGKTAAYQELAKVQDAIQAAEKEASAENTPDGIDALLAQEDRQDQRNARIDELKRQEAFWMDQISRIEAREEAIRKEEERKEAEKLKREQQRQRSIAAFNKPINDARKRMADDPDAMQILEENNREPRTLKEAVADLIPKNGLVLKNWTDSYGRKHLGLEGELGMEAEDLKKLSYFMGKLENGATDITTLAERIYENLPESLQKQAPDGSRDIRDLIIELLSEAQNADHIIHYIDNARIREAEAVYDANKAAEAEYERAMAEHNQEVENETAPTYSAAEDPFSGSAAEAPFSFRGIKTEADRQRHNKRVQRIGGLILDAESAPLEEKTKNLLDTIGRQLGKKFKVDPFAKAVDADGITIGDYIFLSPDTVKDGDWFTRKISGHEMTHAIKASSRDVREVWDKFLTFVKESIGKEEFYKRVDEKLSLYTNRIAEIIDQRNRILKQENPSPEDIEFAQKYANLKMPTREEMEEEVASDFVGEHILTDEKFITDLVKRVEMSKADSASIIQRMRAFIDKMLAYLESLARPTSAERRARVALERARDIWADMYELVAAKQREDLIGNAEAGDEAFSLPKFSIIKPRDKELTEDDKKAIEDLNSGDKTKTKTVYRAMQVIDGKLYPPMAAKIDGKLVESAKEGDILKADEHPELIKMVNGKPKFILDKGSKDATGKDATKVAARYNPYWHTSNSPMNDQFKSAWIRPNLVTVECEIPVSELTSGYKAKYAKDAVGMVPWKSGSVTGELVKQGHPGREVYLSRYCKIGRTLTDAETAQMIKDFIGDKDVSIPENVVTPKVRAELEKIGVKIGEPEKGVNKTEQIEEAIANGLEVDNTAKFSISKTDEAFNSELEKLNEDNADNIILSLGSPSEILKDAGVEDKPMKLYGNKVIKKMKKHGFGLEELKNLPSAVADPIAVFNNHKQEGNRSILTELRTEQGNFLVAVDLGKDGDIDFNIVTSVFGKKKDNINDWLRRGVATYINDQKVKDFLSHQSAPIAAAAAKSSPSDGAKISNFAEINKLFGEKLYIRTKNFKKWFGDWEKDPEEASKVVDENGEPKVVLHGTPNRDFYEFKDEKIGSTNDSGWLGRGFYFYGNNSEYARQYSKGGRVMEVYLDIRNPYYATYEDMNRLAEANSAEASREFREQLEAEGYDGVFYNGDLNEEWVAFHPEQIKSATENNGNFDRSNPDIRFSISARDKEYADAVAAGDKEKVDAMLREEAERKGYSDDSSYQGSIAFNGAAPSRNGYFETRQERIEAFENGDFEDTYSLGDFVETGLDNHDLEWQLANPIPASRRNKATLESIRNLNNAVKSKSGKIKMYRAVDADIKEGSFRNGDWITPSREYAQKHIGLQDWKKGSVIEQEVSIDDVWWDGNDINEWGYDDGKGYVYKNTKNNRKLLEATYDDKGNLIPLSKRFDEKKSDVKFSITPKKNADGDTEFSYEGDPKFSIRVFHGSGADFEKFDHSHMGEGEGNQSFGWGTYVTEVEGVGRQYAEAVGNGVTYKGKKMYADPYSDIPADRALFYIEQEGGTDKAIKFLKELIREEDDADTKREYQECIDVLRDKKSWGKSERHIYEVEIPDDNGRNYIDWKAPLTEENKEDIRAGLIKDKFFRGQEQMTYDDLKSRGLDVPGFEEWLGLRADVLTTSYNGEDFYKGLSQALGGDQIASEFLRDCGFTGIKYPVNAMSGGNSEGTHNYVIFDENDAQIANNTKFSFPKKKEDKTLMGVHNISMSRKDYKDMSDGEKDSYISKLYEGKKELNDEERKNVDKFLSTYSYNHNLAKESFKTTNVEKHPFNVSQRNSDLKKDVVKWAKENGVLTTLSAEETNGKGAIKISADSIKKMTDPSSLRKSDNVDAHLSCIPKLREIIINSIEAESYDNVPYKGNDDIRDPRYGVSDDIRLHRIYGAINYDGTTYRVKTTLKEYKQRPDSPQKAYTYEVTSIKLLSPHHRMSGEPQGTTLDNSFIQGTKLLENVEKSYQPKEKLLAQNENSENVQSGDSKSAIYTDNFKKWFGDWENDPENASKVVDENGEPMVMYHGSSVKAKDIDVFDMLDGSMGKGAYFTSSYEEACDYAKEALAGTEGFPKNAEDISDEDVEQYVGEYYLNVRDSKNITHSRFDRDAIEVIATSPEQIKSATENNGNFDRNNADIRFSISPKKDKKGDIEFAYEGDPKFSIRVFHGSAADFDKFDHKFMGTGEGHQVFGYGTYVTSVEEVGRYYAETAKFRAEGRRDDLHPYLTHNGKKVETPEIGSFNHIFPILRSGSTEEILALAMANDIGHNPLKWLNNVENMLSAPIYANRRNDYLPNIAKAKEEYTKNKDAWKKVYPKGKKVHKHIYEVEIPDDNGDNYIPWDKVMPKETVLDICDKLEAYVKDNGIETYGFYLEDMKKDAEAGYYIKGSTLYQNLADYLPNAKWASDFLSEAGYTGIKVPTNYLSGGNTEGTHNYVIFDADDAKITNNTKFSFRVPEGKTKAQMQAETDRDIAQRRNVVREGDTYEDVLRKAKAVRDADELVKIEQTISDNQIKPGDSFEEVLRKAEALKTAAADQQKFSFSREERARQAYERDRKRQQKEINEAQKALRKKIVDEINYLMNDQHLTVFNRSTLSRLLKDVQNADADNIEQTVTSIRTEIDRLTDKSQQRQLEDLMKLKTRDQNGKGMAIAKNVSDSVRRILGMIQGRIVDLKSTGYEEDMTQLRRQNWFLPGENMRLRRTIERLRDEEPTAERTQDIINAEIAEAEAKIKENEAQVEANKAELADLKVRKQEAESAKALASDADVAEEIAKLMEKMDEHVAGTGTWTPSDSEKLTALQILQLKQQADGKRREIEDMKRKLAELEDSLSRYQAAARHPQRYIPRQRMEQLEQQIQGMKQAINQATSELIGQNGNLIDIVKELIDEGKSSLQNKIETEKNRAYGILHGVVTDIAGDKQIPTDQQKQKNQQEEGKLKKLFSSQLHSFEYLAKRINENSLGEDGFFYNYFIKGKNGVMEAENNHQRGLRDAVDALDAKAQEIYGCSFLKASEKTAEVDYHSGVFTYRDSDGMEIEEEQPLSKGQAMYIYMAWKMPDGKMKLQNQGFTDESIAQVREFLSPEDMQFADWIQEEFLKDRRAKYNDLYVELYNTSMANIENYVPLKILETEVKRDSNLSDDSGRKMTLEEKSGALIERKFNLSPVDITQNAFAVIADHINNMEEWHAFARVRRDLDYVLSNKYIRKQLNANSAGRYNQLYDASAIAAHAYKPNKAEHMDEVVGWLTKGLVGGNIAFRHSTALKQILSVPAFYGYSYDPKFWVALTANIGMQYVRNAPAVLANMATFGISGKAGFKLADKGKMKSLMSENVMWCMKNVPSFRNRVLKGTVGLEYMDQKLNGTVELNVMDHKLKIKVGEMVDKFLDYGMATNQMIDAVTCSIGIKSIFDYRYGKLSEAIEKDTSLTPEQKAEALEEARRKAIMDADIYYNATQQSNHAAFMSSMQMSRSMINRAFSVYQNASIGYARKAVSSSQTVYRIATNFKKLQNEYARRYMAEDPNMDRDEAMFKAREYLLEQAAHHTLNAFLYGYLMNWLWDLGSKGLLGFWWYSSNKKKDREEELRQATGEDKDFREIAGDYYDKAAELISYPGRGLTGMNVLSSLVNRNLNNPLLLFDELEDMQKDIERCIQNEDYTGISTQVLYRGLKSLTGFDARTHINTLLGVKGLIKDGFTGNQDSDFMINLMLVLNTPDTNRRAVAEELYKKYPLDTYVSNIMKASKYTDNEYLALLPGMKLLTAKNEMQIYKEFAFDNLTDEEKAKLKDVTKMKLDQLRTTAELTDAYNKETDVKVKEAIGRMIVKNMKDEYSKNTTSEDLLKKAKESLLGKESATKNVIYTALCTSDDLVDDEMLKEAIAEYKPVMDQLNEIATEGTLDQENEYKNLHKAEIDEYERLKGLQYLIYKDKRDLKDATPGGRDSLMTDIRTLRDEALKRGNAKDGKNKE